MYLNCKTYYSFRYGTISTQELITTAVDKGISSLALTNINSTCDVWEFVKLCKEAGIKPVVGVQIRNEDELLYILIAANNKGLASIHSFLSEHLMEKKTFSSAPPLFQNIHDGFVIYPLAAKPLADLIRARGCGQRKRATKAQTKIGKRMSGLQNTFSRLSK